MLSHIRFQLWLISLDIKYYLLRRAVRVKDLIIHTKWVLAAKRARKTTVNRGYWNGPAPILPYTVHVTKGNN